MKFICSELHWIRLEDSNELRGNLLSIQKTLVLPTNFGISKDRKDAANVKFFSTGMTHIVHVADTGKEQQN
jgi:hypothetical protein